MKLKKPHIILKLVAAFAVTLFFACTDASSELQRFSRKGDGPSATGEDVVLKYTDSGKIVAVMRTPYLLDFGTGEFPYEEFPEGVQVNFFDKKGKENFMTSNYAKRFKETNIIDLRDSVVLILSDSTKLITSQLYWDRKNNWVFTEEPYTIFSPGDESFNKGVGFDSNEKFEDFLSLSATGRVFIDEQEQALNDTLP